MPFLNDAGNRNHSDSNHRFGRVLLWTFLSVTLNAAIEEPAQSAADRIASQLGELRTLPLEDLVPRTRVRFQELNAKEVEIALPLIFGPTPSFANDVLGRLLINRWGELDGPAAYAYAAANTSSGRIALETQALLGWARHAPREAWIRLLMASNRGADERYGEEQILGVVAEVDLSLAIELFQDLMSDRSCLLCNAHGLAINALRQNRLDLITAEISRSPHGPSRDALRDSYWGVMGEYVVKDALASLDSIQDVDDAQAARIHLASGWARRDFAACFAYVLSHYDQASLDQAILPIIQTWARGAVAEDVSAVIKQLPPNLSERSLLGLVPVLARVDPLAATEWAASFAMSAIRSECLNRAMWEWAKIDGEAAQTYLRSKEDLDVRGHLLRSFLLARVGNATLRLADLDDLTNGFNLNWVVGVLAELSLRLADPSINRSGMFDLEAFGDWVRANSAFTDVQRTRILQPLQPPAKQKTPAS